MDNSLATAAYIAAKHFQERFTMDKRWHWWYVYSTTLIVEREDAGIVWLGKQIDNLAKILKDDLIPDQDLVHAKNMLSYMRAIYTGE